jgi:hypothetical protein
VRTLRLSKTSDSRVFAKAPAFRQPRALALGIDGTIWVGDSEARQLFLLSPGGAVQRTLSF